MDEQSAIQSLQRGEICGLEYFVRRYQVKAVRTAYLVTQDAALAEDVVQECFIRVYRAIHGFDAKRPFEPWFLTSVLHEAVKATQKALRQVHLEPNSDNLQLDELLGWAESAETEADYIFLQQETWNAIGKLSPRQRQVIVQRYYLEMSEREMAEQAKLAPGTVKWLLNIARNRLRTLLSARKVE